MTRAISEAARGSFCRTPGSSKAFQRNPGRKCAATSKILVSGAAAGGIDDLRRLTASRAMVVGLMVHKGSLRMATLPQSGADRLDGSSPDLASGQEPSFAAQLRKTLNTIPAYAWYALPSGVLTFVNEGYADYLRSRQK